MLEMWCRNVIHEIWLIYYWRWSIRKRILIIGVEGWIGGDLNACAISTNVGTFRASTWRVICGKTSTVVDSMTSVLWEQTISSCNECMKLI